MKRSGNANPEEGGFRICYNPSGAVLCRSRWHLRARVEVTDNLGFHFAQQGCEQEPALANIEAIPDAPMHLQMVWDTPLDEDLTDELGTDLDLHLRHPSSNEWFRPRIATSEMRRRIGDCLVIPLTTPASILTIQTEQDQKTSIYGSLKIREPWAHHTESAFTIIVHFLRILAGTIWALQPRWSGLSERRGGSFGEPVVGGDKRFWEVVDIDWNDLGPEVRGVDNLFQLSPFN